MSPGKVISDPNSSNHRRQDDSYGDRSSETSVRNFTPSEFVSSTIRPAHRPTTSEPPLRKGTVEDIPAHRPTLPPVVKTEKMEIENSQHPNYLDHLNSISSTANPPFNPTTFKTSKLKGLFRGQEKHYKTYLQNIMEDFYEEPSRSTEEAERPNYLRSDYSKHYAPASGFYPRQREPYPYKNMPRPLPYLGHPRHPSRSGPPRGPPRGRYPPREFDREDLMGNKMDDLKLIDGYIEAHESKQRSTFPDYLRKHRNQVKSVEDKVDKVDKMDKMDKVTPPPPTSSPKLQALTLKQLSAGLSVTTAATQTEGEAGLGVTRDYTVFDMADAVTVTHPPPPSTLERLTNHQSEPAGQQVHRPHFKTYSETAPARISTKPAGGELLIVIIIVCFLMSLQPDRAGGLQHPQTRLHRVRPEPITSKQSRAEADGGPDLHLRA